MTTTPSPWWPPLHRGGGLEELEPWECRFLLSSTHVGRLAYVTDEGPRVVPMNYVIVGDALVFRTSLHNEAAQFSCGRQVAFEVDRTDEFLQTGWSVLVPGVAEEVTVRILQSLDVGRTPDPWPAGMRSLLLYIPLTAATGRRIHAA
jgi:hypothetical protein